MQDASSGLVTRHVPAGLYCHTWPAVSGDVSQSLLPHPQNRSIRAWHKAVNRCCPHTVRCCCFRPGARLLLLTHPLEHQGPG